jgi:hypothetical protein
MPKKVITVRSHSRSDSKTVGTSFLILDCFFNTNKEAAAALVSLSHGTSLTSTTTDKCQKIYKPIKSQNTPD